MALTGYPQEHLAPDITIVTSTHATTQYEGPFSSIKVTGDDMTKKVDLTLYFDKAGFDTNTTQGTDFFEASVMVTDILEGPIYGFRYKAYSGTDAAIIASKYSTGI